MIKDFINGNKFRELCDFDFISPNFKSNKKSYIIYSDLDRYVDAISFASQHRDKNFVLVSHNGDKTVEYTGLPLNIKAWYTQNLNFKHDKVFAIPIGLENPEWHPSKIPTMLKMPQSQKRVAKGFCQFNLGTHPEERQGMAESLSSNNIDVDSFDCVNGQNFFQYLFNLKIYKYCLCPRGNGIDTHRIWEALYMGCMPVVKRHITHEFYEGQLPIIFVDEWKDFKDTECPASSFENPILTMDYWKNRICQSL
tara:strand:+ start:5576 stop:6331 length:756 start_codon:yes stop_codon:yes gene_type:complete